VRFSVSLIPDKSKKRREANSDGNLLCLVLCITNQLEELRESVGGENVGGLIFLPHGLAPRSMRRQQEKIHFSRVKEKTCPAGG
jgi:hypothetical protein